MQHRPDITGLRAVAVLLVVFYHYGIIGRLTGGFIGVDVFFVISGFLITSIINNDIRANTYSLGDFYARRVRRIFPALFAVIVACLCWAFFKLFSSEFIEQRNALLFTIGFVSNIYYYYTVDYFNLGGYSSLVLHTWSLAVEEQFYIFFPIVLAALTKRFDEYITKYILLLVTILSFVACLIVLRTNPQAAFYLAPFRAWELLLGSLLALQILPSRLNSMGANIISAVSVLVLFASALFINHSTAFPGFAALFPCLATVGIIYANTNHQTVVGKILSLKPIQIIGLSSYSLYLWHWPIMIMWSTDYLVQGWIKIALLIVAVTVSILSWKYIEQPFRKFEITKYSVPKILRSAIYALFGMALLIMIVPLGNNIAFPSDPKIRSYLSAIENQKRLFMRPDVCFLTPKSKTTQPIDEKKCLTQTTEKPNILIIGDSHAAHLWAGYAKTYPNYNVMQATAVGCKPPHQMDETTKCSMIFKQLYQEVFGKVQLESIVVAANWSAGDVSAAIELAKQLKQFAKTITIVGPVPKYRTIVPRIAALAHYYNYDPTQFGERFMSKSQVATDQLFQTAIFPQNVIYKSPIEALCSPNCTILSDDGTPLQFDFTHFTENGSETLARRLPLSAE